jgi:periplasmic protein CpxP/Spy
MTPAMLRGTLTVLFNYFLLEGNTVMKHWIKRTLLGALGATFIIGSLTACGTGGHRGGHHGGDWSAERVTQMRGKVVDKISSKLELNDVQKQKLGVLADEMIASRTAFRGKDADPRTELKAMVAGEKFDRTRAQTLLDQKTQVVQGNGPKMIAAMADFYDSLNPAQQKQVREKMEHRGGWWGRG